MDLPVTFWKPEFCVHFPAGQTVLKEGEQGDSMFILLEGEVEVRVRDQVVGSFSPVEVFGEMAAIDKQPRSATVIAKTACKFARIDQSRFKQIIPQRPQFAIDVMRMLVERIRWMDTVTAKVDAPTADPSEKLRRDLECARTFLEAQAAQIGDLLRKLKAPEEPPAAAEKLPEKPA